MVIWIVRFMKCLAKVLPIFVLGLLTRTSFRFFWLNLTEKTERESRERLGKFYLTLLAAFSPFLWSISERFLVSLTNPSIFSPYC
jgi:hypothetical protein